MRNCVFAIGVAALASTAALADGHDGESYMADLDGASEVPGPGDPDGSGVGSLDWNEETEQFCYAIAADDIAPATAAHLHRGAAGEAGPPVLVLETPDAAGGADGCVDAGVGLRREIRENPEGFYFNVHNEEFPAGAVRGQLSR